MITLTLKRVKDCLAFVPPESKIERQSLSWLLKLCDEKHNGYVTLTFSRPKKKRTSGVHSQNSCIHGFAQCIAEYTGENVEKIKDYCKKQAIRQGYPVKRDDSGNILFSPLDGEPIPESSAKISTIEAGYLIDELQILAGELGIILPPTRE
jgi:hypothetical protein